ncbi:MAG: bifunctional phosphopantothenoylcysteine decarboxylase/phosphopantothenate--cysteine ligase CoaBC [Lagierella massiliensis]|nr:bifunctional phosphopantothenoylcysteine decarboxylase/phosphopantothenate--cysteine ligase CoaBC [Lagierella massiliensis]
MKKRILLGVTSGIAIYKVVDLCSKLVKAGYELEVIMTENATKMVSPLVFETMSKGKVHTDTFHTGTSGEVEHIELGNRADLFVIAPTTVNTLAKIASGIADNLLTSTVIAYNRPIMMALSANTRMIENSVTLDNIEKLKKRNFEFIQSKTGMLACNTIGNGRLAEPEEIFERIEDYFVEKDLKGKKIIVTAGPTREDIDPVRYMTNRSSGKMGFAIAKKAFQRGANVVLIYGDTSEKPPEGPKKIKVKYNTELKEEIEKEFQSSDGIIMAAAPCDFRVENFFDQKIKTKNKLVLDLVENEDILKFFGMKKDRQIIIGFAAETSNLIENAKKKLVSKNCDFIIANDVSSESLGFDVDFNKVAIISKDNVDMLPIMKKTELADRILDLL